MASGSNDANLNIDITADAKEASKTIDALTKDVAKLEKSEPEIEIKADDKATKPIDALAKKTAALDKEDVSVDLKAETTKAASDVDTFAQKIQKLSAKDQVITLAMKAAGVQEELQALQLEVSQLDANDPTIDVKLGRIAELSSDLDGLTGKIKEIGDLHPEIDIKVSDQSHRSIQGANDDLEGLRTKGEGFQSALPALRGFTDEMGGMSQAAGVAGQALGDLGDFSAILGEKFGISEETMAGVGAALGGIGLAVVGVGLAVQVGTSIWNAFNKEQVETAKKTKEASDRLAEQSGVLKDLKGELDPTTNAFDAFASALSDSDFTKGAKAMGVLGGNVTDLGQTMAGIRQPGNQFLETMLANAGVADQFTGVLAKGINGSDNFKDAINETAIALEGQGLSSTKAQLEAVKLTSEYKNQVDAALDLNKLAKDNNLEVIAQGQLNAAKAAGGNTEAMLENAQAATVGGTAIDTYNEFLKRQGDAALTASQNQAALAADTEISAASTALAAKKEQAVQRQHRCRVNEKIQENIDKLKADADALNKQSDAFGNAADDQITYTDALADFTDKSKDAKATTDDVRDAAISAAKAHEALYVSTTQAAGGIETATGKLDAQNDTLLATASTASGPAREAILGYIFSLNQIPPDKQTAIKAAIDAHDMATANALINDASKNRTLTITADAETSQAQKDTDDFIKRNNGRKFGIDIIPQFKGNVKQAGGGVTPAGGGIAGEAGPEFIQLPGRPTVLIDQATPVPPGTRVTSVARTRQILQRRIPRYANGTSSPAAIGGAPMTFQYNQNAPVYGVEDLNRHLAQWANQLAQRIQVGKR